MPFEIVVDAVADRGYAALATVDLGADAASIFRRDPRTLPSAASRALAAALRAHPGDALVLQGWPLRAPSVQALAAPPVATAIRTPWAALLAEFAPLEPAPASAHDLLATRLPPLLTALWAPLGAPPPPLRIVDCRPLGPQGRAMQLGGVLTVATSLATPEHALLQVFHEATHPVTDPAVHARLGASEPRATHRDAPGFATHRALEAAAVAYGTAVLEVAAPELLPAWSTWRRRWGA